MVSSGCYKSLLLVKLTSYTTPSFTATTCFTADPVSHSEQARRVDERTGHIFIIRHIDVIPGAVVDARSGAHHPALSVPLSSYSDFHSQFQETDGLLRRDTTPTRSQQTRQKLIVFPILLAREGGSLKPFTAEEIPLLTAAPRAWSLEANQYTSSRSAGCVVFICLFSDFNS